jgi:hypothetical protein
MTPPVILSTYDFTRAYGLAAFDSAVSCLQTSLAWTVDVLHRFLQLAVILSLRVIQGFVSRHRYRAENRRRGIVRHGHLYRRGKTPLAYCWDSIRLCAMTEAMDTRRSRFPLGYTLVDAA